jgi:hypothetical protein
MDEKPLIAAIGAFPAAASSCAADSVEFLDHGKLESTKTRAEVRAELEQAHAQGELNGNAEFIDYTKPVSGKTRKQVRAELEKAYAQGRIEKNADFIDYTGVVSGRTGDDL